MGFPHIAALFPDTTALLALGSKLKRLGLVTLEDSQVSAIPALRAYNPDLKVLWGYIAACELELGDTLASLPALWILTQVGSTLSSGIDASTATIPVTALVNGGLTLFATGQQVMLGGTELATITAVNTGPSTLTVTRGACYTAVSHSSGARVASCASSWPSAVRMDMTDQCPSVTVGGVSHTWVTWRAANALSRCADTSLWDGIYIDLCGSFQAHIVGPDNVTKSIDYPRDNTPTADAYAAFNAAWNAGQEAFDTLIRAGLGDRLYLTNEFLDDYSLRNGTIFEGFPYMTGVDTGYPWDWPTTMYGPRYVGYGDRIGTVTEWMTLCAEPNLTVLMESEDVAGEPDQQIMRYGLATSLIAGSYFTYVTPGSGFTPVAWFDEFDADLGEPVGDAYAVGTLGSDILAGTGAFDGSWAGVWDTSVYGGAAATFDIDTTNKHSGAGCLHADITTVVEGASHVSFSYLSVPDLTLATHYVVHFWAKASVATTFAPSLREDEGFTSIVDGLDEAPLTTEWQEFTRTVTVTGSPTDLANAYLSFVMGYDVCEVWVDEFTIKPGAMAAMRRDFDHGCVVVNPGDTEQTIDLVDDYLTLAGVRSSSLTIAAQDGAVLLDAPPIVPPVLGPPPILILDNREQVVALLGTAREGMCPVLSDKHTERLDYFNQLEVVIAAGHPDAAPLDESSHVIWTDRDGDLRMFTVGQLVGSEDAGSAATVTATCPGIEQELAKTDIAPGLAFVNADPPDVLDSMLSGVRWEAGIVESHRTFSYACKDYASVWENVLAMAVKLGLYVKARVELQGGQVAHFYLDLLSSVGENTGKSFRRGYDVIAMTATGDGTQLNTAVRGLGKANDDGSYLQVLVEDADALEEFGILDTDGVTRRHRIGHYVDSECTDITLLTERAQAMLDTTNAPEKLRTYTVAVASLAEFGDQGDGVSHDLDHVSLGDTVSLVNDTLGIEVALQTNETVTSRYDFTQNTIAVGAPKDSVEKRLAAAMRDIGRVVRAEGRYEGYTPPA